MGTPFDPSQLSPVLRPDFDAGFTAFNVADFEAAVTTSPQYLSSVTPPAGWGGSTKFTLFGTLLIGGVRQTQNMAVCGFENAAGNNLCFFLLRQGSSKSLQLKLATSLGAYGCIATGSQLVYGNNEQPGTTNSGQGRIAWGFVFDGTQTGNANRFKFYVQGVEDSAISFSGNVPVALTNPNSTAAFTLGYGLNGGANMQQAQQYNVGALAGYAATDQEMAALANLAAGSGYPKWWGWGTAGSGLPAGAPAVAHFTNLWQCNESNVGGGSAVARADVVGGANLTDGLGAGGNVASRTTSDLNDLSGNDHHGTSPTFQTLSGNVCTTPQQVAGPNGHNAVHYAPAVNVNSYHRLGQLGMTTLPASFCHVLLGNYDFADNTHEMQLVGTDTNGTGTAQQSTANALALMDNDDFGATLDHPARLDVVVGDGTDLNAWSTNKNAIVPGSWQVFLITYSPNNPAAVVGDVNQSLINVGTLPDWTPPGQFSGAYYFITPLSATPAAQMAEWSYGGVGNTDQASVAAAPMVSVAAALLLTSVPSADDLVRLRTYYDLYAGLTAPTPAAPAGVSVTTAATGLSLSWGAVTGATSYDLYRGTVSGGETLLVNVDALTYLDAGGVTGTTYFYKVVALVETTAGTASSPFSSEVSAPFPPQPPQGLTATRTGAAQVTLAWSPVAGATGYNVYRGTFSGGESFLAPAAANSYVDSSVSLGGTYFYEVTALFNSAESVPSNEASVSLPVAPALTVIDRLNFPLPARRPMSALVTTGQTPYPVGTVLTFQASAFLNGLWWDLTGGTITLELVGPSGNVTGPLAATITNGSPSVAYTVAAPGGQWYKRWVLTDGQGRHQVSNAIAFSVDASP